MPSETVGGCTGWNEVWRSFMGMGELQVNTSGRDMNETLCQLTCSLNFISECTV